MKPFVFYLHNIKSPEQFLKIINEFTPKFKFISYKDVEHIIYLKKEFRNCCHLTFDDGWFSVYNIVFPIIKEYQIPITIFVSPKICVEGGNFWYEEIKNCNPELIRDSLVSEGLYKPGISSLPVDLLLKELPIDILNQFIFELKKKNNIEFRDNQFINIDQLIEMQESGLVEVGAHTMSHPVLKYETSERSELEIKQSVENLSILLNTTIRTFAYPNGLPEMDFTQREINILKSLGIKTAFTVDPGFLSPNVNPFCIPRIGNINRIKIPFGIYLPSRANQKSLRKKIQTLKNV